MSEISQPPSFSKKLWDGISAFGNLQTLWQLVVASGVTSKVMSKLPGGWHPPQYWATGGFVFFGTWAFVASLTTGARKLVSKIRRWRSPHMVTITAAGGRIATLTFTHSGEPATWSVDARVISMLSGKPNSSPQIFECKLHRGSQMARSLSLRSKEWAQMTLASVGRSEWTNHRWLEIGQELQIEDDGAVVEIIIKADPAMKCGHIIKRFKVQKTNNDHFEVVPA